VAWLAAALATIYFLYFFHLGATGLLGPDEPRYASIAREMADSGDFVTPRLWGEPWFEKPALLYWMSAIGFRAGLSPDTAPRLPVAIGSVLFLFFFAWRVRAEFGNTVSFYASAILATSAGWVAYSHIAVTDLPLAVTFSAAVLLLLGWMARGDRLLLSVGACCLGLAVLAKGLVPLALFAPLTWFARHRWRDLAHFSVWGVFIAVAVPWYLLCYAANGWPFVQELFLEHHFGRFASDALQHRQPVWFYVPVLGAGLLPWTPALVAIFRRTLYADARLRLLAAVCSFGFLFFSASTNKLPGYLLPLFPSIAVLLGAGLAAERRMAPVFGLCAAAISIFPAAADILPAAVARGLSRAAVPTFHWTWLLPLPAVVAAVMLERAGKRHRAFGVVATATAAALVLLKVMAYPTLDEQVSARSLWRRIQPCQSSICLGDLHRSQRYGLNYYSQYSLPSCPAEGRPLRVEGRWAARDNFCSSTLTVLSPPL
jgi:4-amino-4-deoxy-L-arabinose transferase-like glycosyltransferase